MILGLSVIIITCSATSCKSKAESDALQQSARDTKKLKEHTPGSIPVSADGFKMKAKIDGKE